MDTEQIRLGHFEKEHRTRFVAHLEWTGPAPRSMIGRTGVFILQLMLRRSYALTSAARDAVTAKNVNALALMSRAHIETVGVLGALERKLQSYYSGKCTYEEVYSQMKQMSLGSKKIEQASVIGPVPEPLHVHTGIKKADQQLVARGMKRKHALWDAYSLLSEFCHPNFHGIAIFATGKSGGFHFREHEAAYDEFCGPVQATLDVSAKAFFLMYDQVFLLLKTNESLPRLSKKTPK